MGFTFAERSLSSSLATGTKELNEFIPWFECLFFLVILLMFQNNESQTERAFKIRVV